MNFVQADIFKHQWAYWLAYSNLSYLAVKRFCWMRVLKMKMVLKKTLMLLAKSYWNQIILVLSVDIVFQKEKIFSSTQKMFMKAKNLTNVTFVTQDSTRVLALENTFDLPIRRRRNWKNLSNLKTMKRKRHFEGNRTMWLLVSTLKLILSYVLTSM